VRSSSSRPRALSTRAIASAGLFLLAAAVLTSTLFLVWYQTGFVSSGGCGAPGPPVVPAETFGQTSRTYESYYVFGVAVPQFEYPLTPPTSVQSYSSAYQPLTGALYETLGILVVLSAIAGVLTAAWLLRGQRPRDRRGIIALAVLVVVVSALAPVFTAAEQPSALCRDSQTWAANGGPRAAGGGCSWPYPAAVNETGLNQSAGPQTTFVGNYTAPNVCSLGASWGPGPAWYLSFVAAALAAAGLAIFPRPRVPPPVRSPAQVGAPAPPTVDYGPPPEAYTPRRP
jgi:uncharacterized membrane protein YidH (DUF202 family)